MTEDPKAGGDEAQAPPPPEGLPSRGPTNSVMIKVARFEGPLDLLLHLIKRDEIDIYDIPIAHITQQYLSYIELMRQLDLDVAGEFLVMAATLMRIKAKMLLPLPAVGEEEDEGDPREELVQRLVEYRQFKEAAGIFKTHEEERRLLFERGMLPGADEAGPLPLAPATLFDLLDALNRVMLRIPEQQVYDVRSETYDVEEKMSLIARTVAELGEVSFAKLMEQCRARAEVIVTFIALLELVKLGTVGVTQPEPFGDIQIVARTPEGSEADAPVES
ncbi:MAG TPA: segregation/condensation protein A [Candidatus Eisenbacteria bacterium]|nr:segregation/condensation protein A [Candidatus Eisenbacteria bacterium]